MMKCGAANDGEPPAEKTLKEVAKKYSTFGAPKRDIKPITLMPRSIFPLVLRWYTAEVNEPFSRYLM